MEFYKFILISLILSSLFNIIICELNKNEINNIEKTTRLAQIVQNKFQDEKQLKYFNEPTRLPLESVLLFIIYHSTRGYPSSLHIMYALIRSEDRVNQIYMEFFGKNPNNLKLIGEFKTKTLLSIFCVFKNLVTFYVDIDRIFNLCRYENTFQYDMNDFLLILHTHPISYYTSDYLKSIREIIDEINSRVRVYFIPRS